MCQKRPQTKDMIGEAQFRAMKQGAYFINNARGTVVDVDALARALKDKHLRGAAVDVFPVEPASNKEKFVSPLQGLDNVILTPHIGGSTEEAQERIGAEVARKLVEYSDIGSTIGAVNFPQVQLPPRPAGTRFIHVHNNVPGMLSAERRVLQARPQHRRAISADLRRHRLCGGRGRRRRARMRTGARGNPGARRHDPRPPPLRALIPVARQLQGAPSRDGALVFCGV